MQFNSLDTKFIEKKGLTLKKVEQQLQLLKSGLPFINLERAATVGDGILKFSDDQSLGLIENYDKHKDQLKIVKFVPASGAATRMFKFLFDFIKDFEPNKQSINAYVNKFKAADLSLFFIGLEKLPFYNLVITYLKAQNKNYNKL